MYNYVVGIIKLHKELASQILATIQNGNNRVMSLIAANLRQSLTGRSARFAFCHANCLYYVCDQERKYYFGNASRGFSLYSNGLLARRHQISLSYSINSLTFQQNDVVIDCGANYGDLWLCLDGSINPRNYITFEPGKTEFRSLKLNAPLARNNNIGLSNKSGLMEFFVNERDADSSLIEPSTYSEKITVTTTTLNEFVKQQQLGVIKLLKLEAEGFEPEILEGGAKAIRSVEFIAVDGGHERGKNQEETLSTITNNLTQQGFEMVSMNFQWGRALFRNSSF